MARIYGFQLRGRAARVSDGVRSCGLGIENQRESLDSSISSNLTEREGKKERKRRMERERENGRSLGFWGFQFSRGNVSYSLKQGK